MHVKSKTATRLQLADDQSKLAGICVLCFAGLFLLLGSAFANALAGRAVAVGGAGLIALWGIMILRPSLTTFDITKKEVVVEQWFLKPRRWNVPFREVTELYILQSKDSDGGPDGFQIYIGTTKGDVQLSAAVLSREAAEHAFQSIADFLIEQDIQATIAERPRQRVAKKLRAANP